MKQQIRSVLRHFARSSPSIEAVLDHVPVSVRLFDGVRRSIPRKLSRMIYEWSISPDRESHAAFAAYAGGDVLDIGSYRGWYSLLLGPKAAKGDSFIAFEPDMTVFPELLFTLHACSKLFPGITFAGLPSAVGDGSRVEIHHPSGTDHPQFGSSQTGNGTGKKTVSGDAAVHELGLNPRFIKIDVEGAEYFVLKGLAGTLAQHRPAVLLEFHPKWQPPGVTGASIENFMHALGYEREILDTSDLSVRELWRRPEGTKINGVHPN